MQRNEIRALAEIEAVKIEAMGMQAANEAAKANGWGLPYQNNSFDSLAKRLRDGIRLELELSGAH